MRFGTRQIGHYRPAEPEVSTVYIPGDITTNSYLDELSSLMNAGFTRSQADVLMDNPVLPYSADGDAAAEILYPSLTGHSLNRPRVLTAPCGHYNIQASTANTEAVPGGMLRYWRSAVWAQKLNEPDTLEFDYPATAPECAGLKFGYVVRLFNQYGQMLQVFNLTDVVQEQERSEIGVVAKIHGKSYLAQFADEFVPYYHATDTYANHVKALLTGFQTSARAVTCGDISTSFSSTSLTVTFAGKSLLDCLNELYKLSGNKGQYSVIPGRQFVWVPRLGKDAGAVKVGYNLKSLKKTSGTEEYADVLYMYGAGLSQNTRLVSIQGLPAGAGAVIRSIVMDNITTQTDLDTYAAAMYDVVSNPQPGYEISAVDLYAAGAGSTINITDFVEIIDTDLDIATQATCWSIKTNLDQPLEVTYTFGRKTRDLSLLLKSITERVSRVEVHDLVGDINTAVEDGDINAGGLVYADKATADAAISGLTAPKSCYVTDLKRYYDLGVGVWLARSFIE